MKTTLLIILLSVAFNFAFGQGTVTLSGTANHQEVDHIFIVTQPLFSGQETEKLLTDYKQNNQFRGTFKLSKPQFLYFMILSRKWLIYVTPGDTIKFTIDGAGFDAKIKFFGNHAANYQVFAMVTDFTGGPQIARRYTVNKEFRDNRDSLLKYKLKLDEWYSDKTKQLGALLSLYPISKTLSHIAQNKIGYYYINFLYSAISDMVIDSIPQDYLNEMKKFKFNDDRLLAANEYKSALSVRYASLKESEDKVNLQRVEKKIRKELSGKTKDYAIASLIGNASERKIAIDDAALLSLIKSAYIEVKDPNYLRYINESDLKYRLLNKPLTKKVLDSTFLTNYSSGKKQSLREVLAGYQGKAVYIDLWASWCGGCRLDIAASVDAKKWMMENGVAVVYFSQDKDRMAWKQASINDKIENDQYLIEGEYKSELSKFMMIESIPRYLLIDKNHFVKSIFAPRPVESDLGQLKSLINEMHKSAIGK
ncbi:redoxin family protein [Pedobacter sp. B4-66]|uniref:TlpA family protein disulfide reductase n=1 Tax=Pedobacter sp. B4-66 TaxID=2817280 RepID=UPI001BDB09E9|nr:redoxin family protein [Pedobacter sp. B4-66]